MINVTRCRASTATSTRRKARICLLDHGDALLAPFSDSAHGYVAKVLGRARASSCTSGTRWSPRSRRGSRVMLGDGTDASRPGAWSGAAASRPPRSPPSCGLAQGRGGASTCSPDLTARRPPRVYVIGDIANIPGARRRAAAAARLGRAPERRAGPRRTSSPTSRASRARPFRYHDKGIMAMIGRGAAIAEVGKRHHEIHGELAHMAWLGVHASLMTGTRGQDRGVRRLGAGTASPRPAARTSSTAATPPRSTGTTTPRSAARSGPQPTSVGD